MQKIVKKIESIQEALDFHFENEIGNFLEEYKSEAPDIYELENALVEYLQEKHELAFVTVDIQDINLDRNECVCRGFQIQITTPSPQQTEPLCILKGTFTTLDKEFIKCLDAAVVAFKASQEAPDGKLRVQEESENIGTGEVGQIFQKTT